MRCMCTVWCQGMTSTQYRTSSYYIRCARRNNIPLPAGLDIHRMLFYNNQVGFHPEGQQHPTLWPFKGIYSPVSVSIAGGTGMDIIKNGGQQDLPRLVVLSGMILWLLPWMPWLFWNKNTTITIGSGTYTWWVGYGDPSKTVKAFVTSAGYTVYNLGD